jgi:prepilin-type N-terminal cleavage/methylation domain-containing protein
VWLGKDSYIFRSFKMKRSFRKAGFTLLEVLMVVAMLAIVGGAIITSYGGLEDKAAKGTATHTIAAVTEAFLVYQSTEGGLPNNLETMAAATPTAPAYQAAELDNSANAVTAEELAGNLRPDKLPGKFGMQTAAAGHIAALKAAGITKIRYMDLKGNDETVADLDIKAADGTDATAVGALSGISIPQHAFEAPRPGNGRNRGRGFYLNLNADPAPTPKLAYWGDARADGTTPGGYNVIKVGGQQNHILVGLGLGNASNLVGEGVFTNLQHAPYYGNVAKHQYNHYIALIDVASSPAKLVAILDSRGDFLDEEFAEATGQKP